MPSLGDFFRLDLPRSFVEPWDEMLQNALMSAKRSMGEGWNAAYMSAPIWRFALGPGQAGPNAILGVVMASVDRVGRQFPLTLAVAHDGRAVAVDHFANGPLFEQLEQLALDALDDGMTQDILRDRLAQLAFSPATFSALSPLGGGMSFETATLPAAAFAGSFAHDRVRNPSVWSAILGDTNRVMLCDGLPGAREVVGLFDMNASQWSAPQGQPA
jgi:type VI secretion system protein ImpM